MKDQKSKKILNSIQEINNTNSTKENKMVISLEQRQVYSEVLEVLRHMEKIYIDKIPKKIIMFFYDNCSLDYEFRMTKSFGEEKLHPNTLNILAILNMNYWSKNKSKEELLMNYAVLDEKTQTQFNSQLEKENIFTKIDIPTDTSSSENLLTLEPSFLGYVKKVLTVLKDAFIKFFGDGE